MDVQLFLLVVAACSSQFVPIDSQSGPTTIPGQVIPRSIRDECPAEELLAEAKRTAKRHICPIINTLGATEDNPVRSCSDIPADCPSDYYWIVPPTGPPAVQVYCAGAWTRVAFLNMSDPNQDCPDGWSLAEGLPIRLCTRPPGGAIGCVSATFSPLGFTYDRVMGRIIAYHKGRLFGWYYLDARQQNIGNYYAEGVSVTHGSVEHIWSFFAAYTDEESRVGPLPENYLCSCSGSNWTIDTRFVGNDYFCDTGNHYTTESPASFYPDDPLWDGAGCSSVSTCCEFNNPPWFTKTLPQRTSDDLEVRKCNDAGYGDTPVQLIELYIQ